MATTFASCVMLLGNVTRWWVPLPRIGLLGTASVTCTHHVPQSCTLCRSILCNHVTSTVSYCKIPWAFSHSHLSAEILHISLCHLFSSLFISKRAIEFTLINGLLKKRYPMFNQKGINNYRLIVVN